MSQIYYFIDTQQNYTVGLFYTLNCYNKNLNLYVIKKIKYIAAELQLNAAKNDRTRETNCFENDRLVLPIESFAKNALRRLPQRGIVCA